VCRGPDNEVRAFLNVCAHRGMIIGDARRELPRRPAFGQPETDDLHVPCMEYDLKDCVYISREKEGYQDRLCKENVGLRRLRCEVKFGGFVWVSLNDNPIPWRSGAAAV